MASAAPSDDDCRGPNSLYVKLVSSDDQVFYALREHAITSSFIRSVLECPSEDGDDINEIVLEVISGPLLKKVCEYFEYRERYKDSEEPPDFEPALEDALDLLIAANYLDL